MTRRLNKKHQNKPSNKRKLISEIEEAIGLQKGVISIKKSKNDKRGGVNFV